MQEDYNNDSKVYAGIPGIWIPGEVMYNDNLKYMDKLLFGLLSNLSKTDDGCFATNRKLGSMIGGRSGKTMSQSISRLLKESYIKIVYTQKDPFIDTEEKIRRIFIDPSYKEKHHSLVIKFNNDHFKKASRGVDKNFQGGRQKLQVGTPKTSNITIIETEIETETNNSSSLKKEEEGLDFTSCPGGQESQSHPASSLKKQKQPSGSSKGNNPLDHVETSCPDKYSIAGETFDSIAVELMIVWDSLGLSQTRKNGRSKDCLVKLLQGKFFDNLNGYDQKECNRAYSKEEILIAIKRRAQEALDPNYAPANKDIKKRMKNLPLYLWVFNEGGKQVEKSRFLVNLKREPRLAEPDILPDQYPEITEAIKKSYIQHVLGGAESARPWSHKQEGSFRQAAIFTKEYFDSAKLRQGRVCRPYNMASWLLKSILEDVEGTGMEGKVNVGWLCSDRTFNDRLPRYLKNEGIVETERRPLQCR